LEVL
jgi:nitrilase